MDIKEFSSQFDILYNSIMSNQAPSIDEYEKSVFLTKAQNELVKNYFNEKGNKYQEGMDDSSRRTLFFQDLIRMVPVSTSVTDIDKNFMCEIVIDPMFILDISVKTENGKYVGKIIAPDEYSRLIQRPYKRPLKHQAWIIPDNYMMSQKEGEMKRVDSVRIILNDKTATTCTMTIRYIKRPEPIILTNLKDMYEDESITIHGKWEPSECELNPTFHDEILQRAVELATASYKSTENFQISTSIGGRSE